MNINGREQKDTPNAVLATPSFSDDLVVLVDAIRKRHGETVVYVSLHEREPTLYLHREKRAIVGIDALDAIYLGDRSRGLYGTQ